MLASAGAGASCRMALSHGPNRAPARTERPTESGTDHATQAAILMRGAARQDAAATPRRAGMISRP